MLDLDTNDPLRRHATTFTTIPHPARLMPTWVRSASVGDAFNPSTAFRMQISEPYFGHIIPILRSVISFGKVQSYESSARRKTVGLEASLWQSAQYPTGMQPIL